MPKPKVSAFTWRLEGKRSWKEFQIIVLCLPKNHRSVTQRDPIFSDRGINGLDTF